ncbi:MAG: DUF3352 domain-containing protein [Planctomycetota bacterium]|nr:DUF3352 domain-containing protein [Planctomycetota bacterium]MEE2990951.1 DUF3352 domain-containing protein [Planctomycetota bacterium]
MKRQILSRLVVVCTLLTALFVSQPLLAQRPSAPKLLPYNTVAYLRIADLQETKDKLNQTSFGRITENEQLQSITGQLFDEILLAYPEIEEVIGVPLDELLGLPQGEVAIALCSTDTGTLMFFVLVDIGDNIATAETVLEKFDETHLAGGGTVETETVGETDVTVYGSATEDDLELFIKEDTVVITTNRLLTEHVVTTWEGTALAEQRTLSENRKFTAIMRQSVGSEEARPQISWFFDPITLVTATTQGNFQAQAVLAFLPTLGLDGFQALGGSAILAPDGFDSISHFHIAMATPRRGILDLLTFGSGEGTPESFVPDDISAYMTLYWNVDEAYDNLKVLVDTIVGEGGFDMRVSDSFQEAVGLDLREDIIESLGGRFTLSTWMEPPARLNSQAMLAAVQMSDTTVVAKLLEDVSSGVEIINAASHNNTSYYRVNIPTRPGQEGQEGQEGPSTPFGSLRIPTPCFGIVGDYLLASDSEKFFQHAIDTHVRGDNLLSDSDDYKLVALNIKDQLRDKQAAAIIFSQPQETFKLLFDLVDSEDTRGFLADNAEQQPVLGILDRVLSGNDLPDLEELTGHLTPSGGVMIDSETGIHLISFTLKAQPEDE